MDSVAEANEPDGVTAFQSDIAQHQHGVERMVKQADIARAIRHHATAIQQEDHTLALTGLEILYGQTLAPRRGTPINILEVVVVVVIAEAFEVVILTDLASFTNSKQAQSIRAGENFEFGNLLEVGENIDFGFCFRFKVSVP